MPDVDPESLYYHPTTAKLEWRCRYCSKRYALNGGTRLMKQHLIAAHEISESSPRQQRVLKRQRTIEEAIISGQTNPRKRRLINTDNSKCTTLGLQYRTNIIIGNNQYSASICPRTLEQLYIDFQISCNLPFSLVQATSFRALIQYINPEADSLLLESLSSIKTLLLSQFAIEKEAIRQRLQSSQSSIHLSLDSWTSSNHLPIQGVIAHTVVDSQLQEYVLALRVIQGCHTGENLAPIVLDILQDYSITHKLGYIQMDNATNNNTLMAALSSGIYIPYSIKILVITLIY
jgi:BED zinc finger